MTTQANVKSIAVVKIVGDKPPVQHHAGDIAGVMKAKNGIGAKVNAFGNLDVPDRGFFKVRIQWGSRHGLLDLAEENFARRPGGLHIFEDGLEFGRRRGSGSEPLEDAVGFACQITAAAREEAGAG